MSSIGFISFVGDGTAKHGYCHTDGGAWDLGIKVLTWLRTAAQEPERLGTAIRELKVVRNFDGSGPTAQEVSRFRRYSNPFVGNPEEEWYALLHGLQGDPAGILTNGYLVDEGSPNSWVYEVNSDRQSFSVAYAQYRGSSWPWLALPTDQEFLAAAEPLDPNGPWDDDEDEEDDELLY